MPELRELLTTVCYSVLKRCLGYRYCTECLDDGPHSCGPHLQATEASLTVEQARVWESLRQLPGVRLRVITPLPPPSVNKTRVVLMILFIILTVRILYPRGC